MVRDGKGGGDKTVGKAEATAWSEQGEGGGDVEKLSGNFRR